jgi:hypothetical protein
LIGLFVTLVLNFLLFINSFFNSNFIDLCFPLFSG